MFEVYNVKKITNEIYSTGYVNWNYILNNINEIYLIGYVNWNYILFLNNFNNINLCSEFYFSKIKVGTQNIKKKLNLLGNELLNLELIKLVIRLVLK